MQVVKRHQNLLEDDRRVPLGKHTSFVKALRELFAKQLGYDVEVILVLKHFEHSHDTRVLNALDDIDFLGEERPGLVTGIHLTFADYFDCVYDSCRTVFGLDYGAETALAEIFHDFKTALQVFYSFNLAHTSRVDFVVLIRRFRPM